MVIYLPQGNIFVAICLLLLFITVNCIQTYISPNKSTAEERDGLRLKYELVCKKCRVEVWSLSALLSC
jgi:hypothetical protein